MKNEFTKSTIKSYLWRIPSKGDSQVNQNPADGELHFLSIVCLFRDELHQQVYRNDTFRGLFVSER